MKQLLFMSFLCLTCWLFAGCSDDETVASEPVPEQHLTCSIFMPEDGSVVGIGDKLIIRGEGVADYGKITSAELKVGGITISDISSVPFYYEYAFKKDAKPGELKIELQVNGDNKATASASITVHVVTNK